VSAFEALFVPADLRAAVSGPAWLTAMLEVERALARAGAAAGLVPPATAAAIDGACTPEGLDWERLLDEARGAGTPAEPLVRALVVRVGEEHGAWVHRGATSQDVMDTASMLVARDGLRLVRGDLARVTAACAALARRERDTPIAGRTLLQQAVPTTFGLKAAGWLVAVLDADARLRELADRLPAELGGAAGTLSALGDVGLDVASRFARELGLVEPTVPWHGNRVVVAELGAALHIVGGVLAKIALDVELLAQTEVGEVREGGEAGGSSAMPQKRNPVGSMWTRAGAALVRGHATVLMGSLAGEHERGAGTWQAEWDALAGALGASGGAATALAGALEGLEVSAARMRENLDRTRGLVVSERVALALTERLGRTAARAAVRDASLRTAASGRTLGEELGALDTGLAPEEIDALVDPTTYLGSAGAFVDRALARYDTETATAEGGS
jgi:3-carboxy-cis,cis-muconate cycloisomerase